MKTFQQPDTSASFNICAPNCTRTPASDALVDQVNADCQTFARYVADAGFQRPSVATQPEFGSALHVEMNLWLPDKPHLNRRKYHPNDAEHNAWQAMQQCGISNRFSDTEISRIFALIRDTFPKLQKDQCAITIFDNWHGQLLQTLRLCGLGQSNAIGTDLNKKPTTLATLGLVQKVVNVYLKYAICWSSVGRYQAGRFIPHNLIPNILDFTCALHAPIDSILIKKLRQTPQGLAWINDGFLDCNRAWLKQANGSFTPWSKLDCAETYQKFQDGLRSVTVIRSLRGSTCSEMGTAYGRPVVDRVNFTKQASKLKFSDTTPSLVPTPYSVVSGNKIDIFINGAPVNFYGIKVERLQKVNPVGCLEVKPTNHNPDGTLCLKNYAMELIMAQGGNFQDPSTHYTATDGATRRCSGTGYAGWRKFGTMLDAVNYLRQYFNVRACDAMTQNRLSQHGVPDVPL